MRVALYERVSTQEQALHGLSIEAQDTAMKKWCEENGHTIAGVYCDLGVSGRKPVKRRPALSDLLRDVERGYIDLILFQKLDRWTRNVQQYYVAQAILDAKGVPWKALYEDYETITAAGRFKVNIMLAVAENEADRTGERVRVVNELKRANGLPTAGHVPIGYVKEKNVISYDEEKRPGVEAFFAKYIETGSISKAQKAAAEHGTQMTYRQADNALTSPIFYGGASFKAPIYITEEQHDIIESFRVRTTRKVQDNRVYLFTGMIYCADCGHRMYGKSTHREKYGDYIHYFCKYHRTSPCPNCVNINETEIEQYIVEHLDEKLSNVELKSNSTAKKNSNKSEITSLLRKMDRTKELFVNGYITMAEFKERTETCKREIEMLQQERPNSEKYLLDILHSDWRSLYAEADKQTKRGFWMRVIRHIEISHNKDITFDVF